MRLAARLRSNRVPVLVLALALLFTPMLDNTPASGVSPGADVVYVAEGTSFADALVGAALAASNNASVLTVAGTNHGDLVPQATKQELTRLAPKSIVILGGTAAVSQKVEDELGTYTDPPGNTSRIKGGDRFATAAEISKMIPDRVKRALFADEAGDADTLDGKHATAFLAADGKAADSELLDGHSPAELATISIPLSALQTTGTLEMNLADESGLRLGGGHGITLDTSFVVPPLAPEAPTVTIDFYWSSLSTDCFFNLRENYTQVFRPGTVEGPLARFQFSQVLSAPSTASTTQVASFPLQVTEGEPPLAAGDAVHVGFFRSSGDQDTCSEALVIEAVLVTFS